MGSAGKVLSARAREDEKLNLILKGKCGRAARTVFIDFFVGEERTVG